MIKKRSNIVTRQDQKEVRAIFKNILDLKNNWNQYNADSFDQAFVYEVQKQVLHLQYKPDYIVPTANDSIQVEYSCEGYCDLGIYLELEFLKNNHVKYLLASFDEANHSMHILHTENIESLQPEKYEQINRWARVIKSIQEDYIKGKTSNAESISN